MMHAALSSRDRRALAVGAVVVGVLAGGARGAPAWRNWTRRAIGDAARSRAELAQTEIAVKHRQGDRAELAAQTRQLAALEPALVRGASPAAAAATLAGLLSGAAAQTGVRLGSIEVHQDSAARDGLLRVRVHAQATGDVRGIMGMLAALERGPTLLAVTALEITQPQPSATDEQAEALRVELDVEGITAVPDGAGADRPPRMRPAPPRVRQ